MLCLLKSNDVPPPTLFKALVVMLNAVFLGIDMQMRISDPYLGLK